DRLLQQSSYELATYSEPADLPCRITSCSVTSYPTPGQLPLISWATNCPDPGPVSVQVKTTTGGGTPTDCRLYAALWDGNKSGSRTADYMAGGYSPDAQPWITCPAVSSAWFWIELWWQGDLVKRSDYFYSHYNEPQSPCAVESFDVINSSTPGVLPVVSWQTSCHAAHGVTVEVLDTTITQMPSGCERDADLFSAAFDGTEPATYMAGQGSCGPVASSRFWLEIRDASNPDLLYERTSFVDAYFTPAAGKK
ncbi:MAG: hypothetical protein MI919_07060, partial [Holophagales bacterium]|nr:hypothetical protein [Holophagales bacterium]